MAGLNIEFDNLHVYIFVFIRMTALIFLNPVFSRGSIPSGVKSALIAVLTLIVAPFVEAPELTNNMIDFLFCIVMEFFIGYTLSFVFSIYYYMMMFASDVLDTQFGLAMAKVMDPQTNVQTAIIGNVMNIMFVIYFFVTDCHLVLINTAIHSFEAVPAGFSGISIQGTCGFIIDLFSSVFLLILRLALPFVSAEFILDISLGLLMKLIPQIHVFVIQMQGKIILALILLFTLALPITNFINNYITKMFDSMNNALTALVS